MFGFVDYFIFSVFGGLVVLDLVAPARAFPSIRHWRLKGFLSAILYYVVATYSPFLWDEWLGQYQVFDGSALPFWVAGPLALTLLLGVQPEAVLFAVLVSSFAGMFQHANLKTPRWVGYLITRPESHALHHQRGVHGYNYGDTPVWDMVFGTFRNPETWAGEAGFYDGASARTLEALSFRLIDTPDTGARSRQTVGAKAFIDRAALLVYAASLSIPFLGLGLAIAPTI